MTPAYTHHALLRKACPGRGQVLFSPAGGRLFADLKIVTHMSFVKSQVSITKLLRLSAPLNDIYVLVIAEYDVYQTRFDAQLSNCYIAICYYGANHENPDFIICFGLRFTGGALICPVAAGGP